MTFLAIDVGNTRLKWAQYVSPKPGAAMVAHGAVFLETIDELAETDWKALAPPHQMLGCVVAGEAVRRRVEEQMELWDVEPHWVFSTASEAGLLNGYDHPNRLGSDRWVSLIGARARLLADNDYETLSTRFSFSLGMVLKVLRLRSTGSGLRKKCGVCTRKSFGSSSK